MVATAADDPGPSLVIESGPRRGVHSGIEQDKPDVVTSIGDDNRSSSIRFDRGCFVGGVVRELAHGPSSTALSPIETLEDGKKFSRRW